MSQADQRAIRSISEIEGVTDCDAHLTERQSDFISYIEKPFSQMLNRGVGDDYGYLSSFYPSPGFLTPIASGKADSDSVRSPGDVKEGMEMLDTERAIITPTQNLYLGCVQHWELASALARAYNEWILDEFVDEQEGVYSSILIAPQRPDKAAEEIDDRSDEPGMVAAFLPAGGATPPLGDEKYFPIYQACQDNDLPLMLHGASGTQMKSFPQMFYNSRRFLINHTQTSAMTNMANITHMVGLGVPVRFPEVDFVVQEGGLGWIPFLMRRMDDEYSMAREDAPMLKKPPSEYIRDHFYFTSQPIEGLNEPTYINNIIRLFGGENNLMFSSDFPHIDFDHPDKVLHIFQQEFSDDEIRNIFAKTAERVYQF